MEPNRIKLILLALVAIGAASCHQEKIVNIHEFEGDASFIGQYYAKSPFWNHWMMLDSSNKLYRWGFDQMIPDSSDASYVIRDSTIYITHPPAHGIGESTDSLIIKRLNQNTITFIPFGNRQKLTYVYRKDTFNEPLFADIHTFMLTKKELDSLAINGNNNLRKKEELNAKNAENMFLILEHTGITWNQHYTKEFFTRDSTKYNKIEHGGYGIVFQTNDTVLISEGIPDTAQLARDIERLFPFIDIF